MNRVRNAVPSGLPLLIDASCLQSLAVEEPNEVVNFFGSRERSMEMDLKRSWALWFFLRNRGASDFFLSDGHVEGSLHDVDHPGERLTTASSGRNEGAL
jgi:hypothetical protein